MNRHDDPRAPESLFPARRSRGLFSVLVIALCCLLVALSATPANAAGLLVAEGGFGGRLEIVEQTVDVTINNGIAVTTINQTFRNLEKRQVEALYTFPVPKGASVSNFSMWIDGQEMVGEVVEKERAREIYESYKQTRRDPGLLEQVDYKTFEMRIFPIGPEAEQQIQIRYYQELEFDDDWATYVYPLATTTRRDIDNRTQGRFGMTVEIASEVPIAEIESPSHADAFAFAEHTKTHARASLETTGGDLGRDVVLAYRLERPRTGLDLIASKQRDEDGYFLITMTAGDELGKAGDAGMDYVFVLDISGSMNDDGKLRLSRSSLDAFVRALGPQDRFDILTFNVASNPMFSDLRAADDSAKQNAADFLRGQKARGGTFLEPAIRAAYGYKDADRPLNVVILSDGMSEQRERQALLEMIGQRPSSTRVFAIGVGNDVNRPLLQQITEDAGGLAAFISRGDNFERQAKAFRRKLLRPAATNLELSIDGGGVYDIEPGRLPNLYHGAPLRVYGRYADPGAVRLTVKGDLGTEPFEKSFTVELPKREQNPELERMWAWHRVQRLIKDADRTGSRADVKDEIVRLGEAFSIATEYTSFLVLENDAEYRRWKVDRRNALRVERDRAKLTRVRDELARLRKRAAPSGPPASGPAAEPARIASNRSRPSKSLGPQVSSSPDVNSRSRGSSPGGGAIDPFSFLFVAALSALALVVFRRNVGLGG